MLLMLLVSSELFSNSILDVKKIPFFFTGIDFKMKTIVVEGKRIRVQMW